MIPCFALCTALLQSTVLAVIRCKPVDKLICSLQQDGATYQSVFGAVYHPLVCLSVRLSLHPQMQLSTPLLSLLSCIAQLLNTVQATRQKIEAAAAVNAAPPCNRLETVKRSATASKSLARQSWRCREYTGGGRVIII